MFGITTEFAEKNPNTTLALTKALIRAAIWLDENDNANRLEAVKILAKPEYVGADDAVIANSMTGTFEYEKGDKRAGARLQRLLPLLRHLSLLLRCRLVPDPDAALGPDRRGASPTAGTPTRPKSVYLPGHLSEGGQAAGRRRQGQRRPTSRGTATATSAPTADFIDGVTYDGRKPNAYIDSLPIGLKGNRGRRRHRIAG